MCFIIVESANPVRRICRICTIAALVALARLSICERNKTAYKSLSLKVNLDVLLDSVFFVLVSVKYCWKQQDERSIMQSA